MKLQWYAYVARGATVTQPPYTVTPCALRLGVRWPGGGWVWDLPVAVEVGASDPAAATTRRTLPVVDITRWVQIGLWLIPLGMIWMLGAAKQRRKHP